MPDQSRSIAVLTVAYCTLTLFALCALGVLRATIRFLLAAGVRLGERVVTYRSRDEPAATGSEGDGGSVAQTGEQKVEEVRHTFEHADAVRAIAMRDGLIASGGDDNKVVVRDATSGEVRHTFEHAGTVLAIAKRDGLIASDRGNSHNVVMRSCPASRTTATWADALSLAPRGRAASDALVLFLSTSIPHVFSFSIPCNGRSLIAHAAFLGMDDFLVSLAEATAGSKASNLIPPHGLFGRDVGGRHALDYALEKRQPRAIRALLELAWAQPPPSRRALTRRALGGTPLNGEVSPALVRVASRFPALLGDMLHELGLDWLDNDELLRRLEQSRAAIGGGVSRARAASLRHAGNRRAVKGHGSLVVELPKLWAGERARDDADAAQVDVRCGVVGLPGLLGPPSEAGSAHHDLFRCLVEAQSKRVITSPAMVAAINFKWQAFGQWRWMLELLAFAAYFFGYLVGLYLVLIESRDSLRRTLGGGTELPTELIAGAASYGAAWLVAVYYIRVELSQLLLPIRTHLDLARTQGRNAPGRREPCRAAIAHAVADYFARPSNLVDLLSAFDVLALPLLVLHGNSVGEGTLYEARVLGAVGALLMVPRAAAVACGSERVGFLVAMLVAVFKDMRAFVAVMGFVVVTAAFALALAAPPDLHLYRTAGSSLFTAWGMLLGGFDTSDYLDTDAVVLPRGNALMVALFVAFTFVVNIVLFNLLIAVISDTYEIMLDTQHARGLKQRARMILHLQDLMSPEERRSPEWFPNWLHTLERVGDGGSDGDGGGGGGNAGFDEDERRWKQRVEADVKATKTTVEGLQAEMGQISSAIQEMLVSLPSTQRHLAQPQPHELPWPQPVPEPWRGSKKAAASGPEEVEVVIKQAAPGPASRGPESLSLECEDGDADGGSSKPALQRSNSTVSGHI